MRRDRRLHHHDPVRRQPFRQCAGEQRANLHHAGNAMSTRANNGQSSCGPVTSRVPGEARGFSLIELMIAMVLGLVVISGVTSIFLANQNTYRANAALSDVQEGSRIAFEMLARDVRGAGQTGCDSTSGRVANVINPVGGATPWYADWNNAVHGYDDGSADDSA